MAGYVNADRVQEQSTTTGTGTYSLNGETSGFRTFVAGAGTGNHVPYLASDSTGWEIGIGLVTDATPDTLARTKVLKSSNADAAVNWGAGTRKISCVPLGDIGSNRFLGRVSLSSPAITLGPIIIPVGVTRLWGHAFVVAPGALVPRMRLGGAAIDTGSNYAATSALNNANNVGLVSTSAMQLIVAAMASTEETYIEFSIVKPTAAKMAKARWNNSSISISAGTAPLPTVGAGIWANTADLMQRIELCGFTAITGTTTTNLGTGTELCVYGSYEA